MVCCDGQVFEKLKTLDAHELGGKTEHYLSKDEVKAVMARRDKIVALPEDDLRKGGERSAVLTAGSKSLYENRKVASRMQLALLMI